MEQRCERGLDHLPISQFGWLLAGGGGEDLSSSIASTPFSRLELSPLLFSWNMITFESRMQSAVIRIRIRIGSVFSGLQDP